MQDLTDFECPICLQLCVDAVESQCCGHAFCEVCAKDVSVSKKECPFCRGTSFTTSPSKVLRRVISSIGVECPYPKCGKKVNHGDLDQHIDKCEFKEVKCQFCEYNGLKMNVFEHMTKAHVEETMKLLLDSAPESNPSVILRKTRSSKIKSSSAQQPLINSYDPLATVLNSQGRQAGIGQSGKYYCGGKLGGPKCNCCDGNCGPTNGENCVGCMALDIKLRNLPKGYLVNADGRICKISGKKAYCGTISSGMVRSSQCSLGIQCRRCSYLNNTLSRYQTLL